jgi:hypothetical protein
VFESVDKASTAGLILPLAIGIVIRRAGKVK